MKKRGVNIGTCGVSTVRLRPMLIFDETHSKFPKPRNQQSNLSLTLKKTVPIFIETLDTVLSTL